MPALHLRVRGPAHCMQKGITSPAGSRRRKHRCPVHLRPVTPRISESHAATLKCLAHEYKPVIVRPKQVALATLPFVGTTESREAYPAWPMVGARALTCGVQSAAAAAAVGHKLAAAVLLC